MICPCEILQKMESIWGGARGHVDIINRNMKGWKVQVWSIIRKTECEKEILLQLYVFMLNKPI